MSLLTTLFRRSEKHRTYTNLLAMDDRLLRDIGLTRSDVHELMAGARISHGKGRRANA
jgi:uncharacterized protein YjiS (DUF1127 family)